jgi:hypothetical protein
MKRSLAVVEMYKVNIHAARDEPKFAAFLDFSVG